LLVAANVTGAKISVDGQTGPDWVTPYTISELSVGSHQLVVSKEGYDNYQGAVTIEAGKTNSFTATLPARPEPPPPTPSKEPAEVKGKHPKIEVEAPGVIPVSHGPVRGPGAAPKVGQLLVSANISGARISVDGRSESNWVTPHSSTIDLPAGTHQVVVSKEGYEDFQRSVTVEGGKTSTVNAPLSVGSGEVEVVTKPPGLEVFIDGKSIGISPAHSAVIAGSHSFSITRPEGGTPYERTFNVKSGEMPVFTVNMTRPGEGTTGIVNVKTIPSGATVSADGNSIASQTPTSFSLNAGRHTLVISLSGYRPQQRMIEVKAGEPVEVDVSMPRQ
jgi:hypothetical protein